MGAMSLSKSTATALCFALRLARRPRREKALGTKYIQGIKGNIDKWFGEGEADFGKKRSVAYMCENLQSVYPYRFDI